MFLKLRPPVVEIIEMLFEGLTCSVTMGGFETLSDVLLTFYMLTVLLGMRVASDN